MVNPNRLSRVKRWKLVFPDGTQDITTNLRNLLSLQKLIIEKKGLIRERDIEALRKELNKCPKCKEYLEEEFGAKIVGTTDRDMMDCRNKTQRGYRFRQI